MSIKSSSQFLAAATLAGVLLAPTASKAESFTVCAGEYERACKGSYEVYVYCGETDNWAKQTCMQLNKTGEYTKVRLRSHGGNKCGYAYDRIYCR
jgi:hypothetical protein